LQYTDVTLCSLAAEFLWTMVVCVCMSVKLHVVSTVKPTRCTFCIQFIVN
jgi:hypothetical protein